MGTSALTRCSRGNGLFRALKPKPPNPKFPTSLRLSSRPINKGPPFTPFADSLLPFPFGCSYITRIDCSLITPKWVGCSCSQNLQHVYHVGLFFFLEKKKKKPFLSDVELNSLTGTGGSSSRCGRAYDALLLDAGGTLLQLAKPVEETYAAIGTKYG